VLVNNSTFPCPSAMRILGPVWKVYVFAWEPIFVHAWNVICGGVSMNLAGLLKNVTYHPSPSIAHRNRGRQPANAGNRLHVLSRSKHQAVSIILPLYPRSRDCQLLHLGRRQTFRVQTRIEIRRKATNSAIVLKASKRPSDVVSLHLMGPKPSVGSIYRPASCLSQKYRAS
jgi:hypothetical protein